MYKKDYVPDEIKECISHRMARGGAAAAGADPLVPEDSMPAAAVGPEPMPPGYAPRMAIVRSPRMAASVPAQGFLPAEAADDE